MDDVRQAVQAVSESLIAHLRQNDDTKYGPLVTDETEFKTLIEEGDYEDIRIGDLPSDQYGAVKEIDGIDFLVFDTDNIPIEVLLENSEIFSDLHGKNNGFPLEDRGSIAKVVKSNEAVGTTFNRYRDRLPHRLLPIFEEALVLRETERKQNLSRGTIYDWRGEIATKHGDQGHDPQEAQHLISLCSTGYFDKDDVFDEMYTELVENGIKTIDDYKDTIGMYIKKNPFAVFVNSSETTIDEACTLAVSKAGKLGDFPGSPSFIDVCGKGKGTHDLLDKVRGELSAEYGANVERFRNREIEQYILRIDPSSL